MLIGLVCVWLFITGPGPPQEPTEVRVELEVFDWHSKRLPPAFAKPGTIPANTKPSAVLAVKATLGKPFAVDVTAGSRKMQLTGVVQGDSQKGFVVTVNASRENRKRGEMQATSTTIKLLFNVPTVISGMWGTATGMGAEYHTGTAMRVRLVKEKP